MKRVVMIIAALTAMFGAVFLLQGLRYLPSPVMYGKPEWVVIGAAMMVISAAVMWWASRRQ